MLKLPYGHRNNTPGPSGWGYSHDTWLTILVLVPMSLTVVYMLLWGFGVAICGMVGIFVPEVCYGVTEYTGEYFGWFR